MGDLNQNALLAACEAACAEHYRINPDRPWGISISEMQAAITAYLAYQRDEGWRQVQLLPTAMQTATRAWYEKITTQPTVHGQLEELAATITAAIDEERRACQRLASEFTMKPDRSVHPDVPWDEMNETAKMVAHTTAQQIASAINARGETQNEGDRQQ